MSALRPVFVLLGLGLAACALLLSWPLDARAAAASIGLFTAACALGPPEVRAFLRRESPSSS
jgi:hypothetical protein